MSKTAILFPGQASQYVGMAKDLYQYSDKVRLLYQLASDEMSIDIAKLSFDGPVEDLKRTSNTQPAILLHSLAIMIILGDNLPDFDFAAGHSLGEYGALAAAGAISFEDALRVVIKRASLMEDACRKNRGTMAAIIGLSPKQVNEVCDKASESGIVVPANFNSNRQIVISGSNPAVERAVQIAKDTGAKRAMMLEVGGAFHSPLMEPACEGLKQYIDKIEINNPDKIVVANVTAGEASTPLEIKELLVKQVTAPVRWAETMAYLKANDVTSIIEIGPGKVLTGLARREMNLEQSVNLDSLDDLKLLSPVLA